MQAAKPGDLLGGKYRFIRHLGRGGMGTVWHAQHLVLNAPVALKFIGSGGMDEEGQQRFLGEARMAAALRSAHVVQILDYGVCDGIPYIAMELLEGESLAERLAREGRLALGDTSRVLQHVVRAIGRAHDVGIVHRDLKPENVFIVRNEDEELIKVLDFGIAKGNAATLGDSAAVDTRSGALLGTPHYMSPEQVDGGGTVDFRTDIWSLGVLAYRCLLGTLPFAGDSVGRLLLAICSRPLPIPSEVGAVPAGFDAWFARACARDPAARFTSARQAVSEFLALAQGVGLSSNPSDTRPGEAMPEGLATRPEMTASTGRSANVELASRERRERWAKRGVLALALGVGLIWLAGALERGRAPQPAPEREAAASAHVEFPPPSSWKPGPAQSVALEPSPAPAAPPETATEQSGVASAPAPHEAHLQRTADNPAAASARPPVQRATPRAAASVKARAGAPPAAKPSSAEPSKTKPFERVPAIPPPDIDLGI